MTKPDAALHVTNQAVPIFLPDGRHFPFWQFSAIPDHRGMYIGSLDSKPEAQDSRRLLATAFWPCVYAPSQDSGPGYILFLREHSLMAQRFDDKRLELAGEPMPVAEHVGLYNEYGYFSASTNGVLVYRAREAAKWRELVMHHRAMAGAFW